MNSAFGFAAANAPAAFAAPRSAGAELALLRMRDIPDTCTFSIKNEKVKMTATIGESSVL